MTFQQHNKTFNNIIIYGKNDLSYEDLNPTAINIIFDADSEFEVGVERGVLHISGNGGSKI